MVAFVRYVPDFNCWYHVLRNQFLGRLSVCVTSQYQRIGTVRDECADNVFLALQTIFIAANQSLKTFGHQAAGDGLDRISKDCVG